MSKSDFATGSILDVPFGEWARVLELPENEHYRVRQVQEWIFTRRAKAFSEMTNLPEALRRRLNENFRLRALTLTKKEVSERDGTTRLFFETLDKRPVSAVFLPSTRGEEGEERYSLCLSSQVGCAWGCVFCASGRVRFDRNLEPSEIMDQVFLAEEATGKKIGSLLFMGMGEPLANYNNLLWALRCFRSPLAFNYGGRHITVSTCGLVPQILKLSEEAPKVNLAISLHAADDETRAKILPRSSRWPIKDLLKAAWAYQKRMDNVRVTFEYILLKGVNDSIQMAQRLSNLLRERRAWVNLIVYNPVEGLPYERPSSPRVDEFEKVLTDRGIFVRVRKPQGVDISAGCGQLGEPTRLSKFPPLERKAVPPPPAVPVQRAPEAPPIVQAPPPRPPADAARRSSRFVGRDAGKPNRPFGPRSGQKPKFGDKPFFKRDKGADRPASGPQKPWQKKGDQKSAPGFSGREQRPQSFGFKKEWRRDRPGDSRPPNRGKPNFKGRRPPSRGGQGR